MCPLGAPRLLLAREGPALHAGDTAQQLAGGRGKGQAPALEPCRAMGAVAEQSAGHGEKGAPAGWDAEAQADSGGSPRSSLEPAKSLTASLSTEVEEDDADLHRHGEAAGPAGVAGAPAAAAAAAKRTPHPPSVLDQHLQATG